MCYENKEERKKELCNAHVTTAIRKKKGDTLKGQLMELDEQIRDKTEVQRPYSVYR